MTTSITRPAGDRKILAEFLNRLVEGTSPNANAEGKRKFSRQNRTLPAMLLPYEHGRPLLDQTTFATTKDLSAGGGALLLQQDFPWDEFVIALPYRAHPYLVLSQTMHRTPVDFGFWQLGVEWVELLNPRDSESLMQLVRLAQRLSATVGS